MTQAIIHDADRQQWLLFREPEQIIRADRLDQVVPNLCRLTQEIQENNLYAAGFISYEAAPAFDPALRTHALTDFPLLWFGLYRSPEILQLPQLSDLKPSGLLQNWRGKGVPQLQSLNWTPAISRSDYDRAIATIKQQIAQGETYQVNYTLRLHTPFTGDPWPFFLQLVQAQQADYAAYVELDQFAICSASPELFFRLSDNQLTTRPMKGTAARGLTWTEDCERADWLHHSTKNRAENVMIVDMLRNDLGRIAEIGSVQIPKLFEMERYPTIWQMTSTVTATTTAPLDQIMAALFPCASITGAPKPSTMQLIRDLERTPRGIYTGCIGWIAPNRQAQFNVAIRTVVIDTAKAEAEYGVGGGIVWDSESGDEYEECQIKAKVLTSNRPNFSLLETLLWEPEGGYFLWHEHLQRLQNSALYFGIPIDRSVVEQQLSAVSKAFSQQAQKVRLLLSQTGCITCETTPLPPLSDLLPDLLPVKLGLAPLPIDSTNPFLYHKTTHRQVYEQACSTRPDCEDVLLWNERGEVTESCIANVVVKNNGEYLTPPVRSGLLAGTFRADLLAMGKVREAIILVEFLKQCEAIYLVNSVRKWREATIEL